MILVRHIEGVKKLRAGDNYAVHEEKYDFSGLSFPVFLHTVNIFEKKNPNDSVKAYGLEKFFQPLCKCLMYVVYPLNVVDDEEKNSSIFFY